MQSSISVFAIVEKETDDASANIEYLKNVFKLVTPNYFNKTIYI